MGPQHSHREVAGSLLAEAAVALSLLVAVTWASLQAAHAASAAANQALHSVFADRFLQNHQALVHAAAVQPDGSLILSSLAGEVGYPSAPQTIERLPLLAGAPAGRFEGRATSWRERVATVGTGTEGMDVWEYHLRIETQRTRPDGGIETCTKSSVTRRSNSR